MSLDTHHKGIRGCGVKNITYENNSSAANEILFNEGYLKTIVERVNSELSMDVFKKVAEDMIAVGAVDYVDGFVLSSGLIIDMPWNTTYGSYDPRLTPAPLCQKVFRGLYAELSGKK